MRILPAATLCVPAALRRAIIQSKVAFIVPDRRYLKRRTLRRHARGLQLWALGVAAVISGDFFGGNFGLIEGGFGGMLAAMVCRARSAAPCRRQAEGRRQGGSLDPTNTCGFSPQWRRTYDPEHWPGWAPLSGLVCYFVFALLNVAGVELSFQVSLVITILIAGSQLGFAAAWPIYPTREKSPIGATLLNMAVFGSVVAYIFQMVSFIRPRLRFPRMPRPYRRPPRIPGTLPGMTIAAATLVTLFLNSDYRPGLLGAAIWFLLGIVWFAAGGRQRLVLAPEEKFAEEVRAAT